MIRKEISPYKCNFCHGQTIRVPFSEQVDVVTELREDSGIDLINDFDMKIMDALMTPAVAPHGMVRCEKCGKTQNVTYEMIGRTLCMVDTLPQGAMPRYKDLDSQLDNSTKREILENGFGDTP